MFKFLIFVSALVVLTYAKNVDVKEAIVSLVPVNGKTTTGKITFKQTSDGVDVDVTIDGLDPKDAKHGLVVHAVGDVSGDVCANVGDHFNPHKKSHGTGSSKSNRHVGDLGNVVADANGKVTVKFTDKVISLNGEDHIVGKAVVVHAQPDDLGKGTDDESKKSGNVGAPLACGIVGITSEKSGSSAVVPTIITFVVAVAFKML